MKTILFVSTNGIIMNGGESPCEGSGLEQGASECELTVYRSVKRIATELFSFVIATCKPVKRAIYQHRLLTSS